MRKLRFGFGEGVRLLLALPKSVFLNFKCLPAKQAVKLPVLVDHKVKLRLAGGV